MTVDSRAIVTDNAEWSSVAFSQFPPLAVSCRTIVQCHNQYFVIDTVKIQDISITTGIPSYFFFFTATPISTCPHPLFNLWQQLTGSPFIILSEYYVWNHTVCDLLELAFSLSIILWRCIYAECIDNSFPFYYWGLFHGKNVPQLNCSPTEGYLGCFQLMAITIKLL